MTSPDSIAKAEIAREAARRRTFAIISHPDAGKTTLTEKLLLYSGMVRTAGMVGGRKGAKAASSDWMSMEQERGISITASAMQFPYKGVIINILDTPGHQDFSEDTYRTLTAADSVIMVLDAAKGVEIQTRKLFEACRLRGIPVFTFINKWDMPGRDALDLMAEVEDILGIAASPIDWPIGRDKGFRGVVDLQTRKMHLYTKTATRGSSIPDETVLDLDGEVPESLIEAEAIAELRGEIDLVQAAGNRFDHEAFLANKITPVFFGSALTNFGVEPLFDAFVDLAPAPGPRPVDVAGGGERMIDPVEEPFSAYVFKLQANMNPKHRDCVAFMRIVSGRYERDMQVRLERLGRSVRLARPHTLMVAERETLDVAWPGDIIGVISPGDFAIGDTLSVRGGFSFKPLPAFQPELFARVRAKDTGRRKALDKGLAQIALEGAVQILREVDEHSSEFFVGAVGRLQFDVLQYRLADEYNVQIDLEPLQFQASAWLVGDPASFRKPFHAKLVRDHLDRPMVLFTTEWQKQQTAADNPDHQLVNYA